MKGQKNLMKNTTIKGIEAFMKFAPYLADRAKAIETPCEGFATIQLGPFEGEISGISIVELIVGGEHPQHRHDESDNTFHFSSGKGYVILGENQERVPYSAGTVIEAPRGMLHGFEVTENGIMVATHRGGPIVRKDGTMDIHYTDPRCFTPDGTVGGD